MKQGVLMRRLIAVGVIAAMPLSVLGSVALAGAASAASSTPVTCTKMKGNLNTGGNFTLSKCSDTAATGGSGTFPSSSVSSGSGGTITWHVAGSSTKVGSITEGSSTATCAAGDDAIEATGSVLKSKGAAKKAIPAGWEFTANVCYNPNTGAVSEAKGYPVTFEPAG